MSEPASQMAYFFALSGRTLALLHSGQFGELVQIIRAGTAMAEKNGADPWLFSFREAWLRIVILDFTGARQLCEALTDTTREHSQRQPRAIARLAAGYAHIEHGEYDGATEQFHAVLNPEITPKFFLHWYFRMNARLGLCNAWLAAGDLGRARREADRFLESACATAEPNLQAFAWEAQARVEMAGSNWTAAANKIQKALAIVETFAIPTAAWHVHATSWELSRHVRDGAAAERHRARAEAIILSLVGSFAPGDPLRTLFLAAPAVRRIRGAEAEGDARDGGSKTRARHLSGRASGRHRRTAP